MGSSGDQIGHLWWRFLNGDIPVAKHPKAAVVLIGTNDMTADDCHQTEKASMRAVTGVVSRYTFFLLHYCSPVCATCGELNA